MRSFVVFLLFLCYCCGQPGTPTLPDFPTDVSGTFFSGVFSDHAILQRSPQTSAVYGVVIGAKPATKVTVKVSGDETYSVGAAVQFSTKQMPGGGVYAWWNASLKAHVAGGNYSINAACSDCISPTNSSTISDVTFGDIWFCSGSLLE
jgi:hypothetical protein